MAWMKRPAASACLPGNTVEAFTALAVMEICSVPNVYIGRFPNSCFLVNHEASSTLETIESGPCSGIVEGGDEAG